jgi:hypothetical protein
LPDNAIAEIADDEVEKYRVVRIADEIVVDLLKEACGIDYERAGRGGIEIRTVDGVLIPIGSKELLIETKQTVRPSDAVDVQFLRLRIEAEGRARVARGAVSEVSPAMRMQEIDSSAIAAVGYDAEQQILRLKYRGGDTYDYLDVPPEEFREFMNAPSRGIYANKIIKPNYEYRKV